ncbi:class I SAM-dependent methyltransferase [Candidatus Latescibacterota bacterium]
MNEWYRACDKAANILKDRVPPVYRSRTFPGILGDIKALSSKKALSLINRKKGIGTQYAFLYLTCGIGSGQGYQACAAEALKSVFVNNHSDIFGVNILDVGCAVGVTAGVMGLENVTGFDLFPDLLRAAQLVDSYAGVRNNYTVADMTRFWPFERMFDTVVCGLVCHHLKKQSDIITFFSQANRVLVQDGWLVITLPSGSVSTGLQFSNLTNALEGFGFRVYRNLSGIVLSTDSTHSLFWMFVITANKVSEATPPDFINSRFGFPDYRTPVSREEKGVQVKMTADSRRKVKHEHFTLIGMNELLNTHAETILTYPNVSELI